MTVHPVPRPPRYPRVAGAGELLISGDIFEGLVWGSLVTWFEVSGVRNGSREGKEGEAYCW